MAPDSPIQGVIFDLDGVLVTTDELHFQSWKAMADEEGIPFTRQDNERLRGVSRMASLDIILEKATRAYTDAEKEALAAKKNTMYRTLLGRLTPADLLPGARATVEQLRAWGIKTAIGSSSRNTPLILEQTGLRPLFDAVADGNDIQRSKPDPEVFLIAAQRLGLEPAQCLVIEDAVAGIEAAVAGGFHAFGIGAPESLPNATRLARSLAEVEPAELLRVDLS
jgi:beta-phosphoglucomutase